ncbi:MAG: hypothetical protein QF921_06990 [Pseudomonadales bacterium]|nr:hypothetical protein [Pseudomonadales bacterium]MDP6469583.1 hypothetical protein [Pseudomonadales bacterium]MDP6827424.1 hypothetical protein [Pseudomonadales bacterium]MDP6971247.1 hypothetical protein [Pseudomonadales bacterium]
MSDAPSGFEALETVSPFSQLVGPYYKQMRERRPAGVGTAGSGATL